MDINQRADELIDRFWTWRLLDIPELATFLGRHEYDDRLMDMSLNAYLRRRDDAKLFLKDTRKLKEVANKENASYETLFNIDYLEDDLDCFIKGLAHHTYLCPLNPIEGPHIRYPGLVSWMKKNSVSDIEMILTRLRQFPRQIDQHIELLTEGIRKGITMHIQQIQPFTESLQKVSEVAVLDSKLFAPFKERPEVISKEKWYELVQTAKDIIGNDCLPAFKRLAVFIRDVYIPKCRTNVGIGTLPNGKEIYEAYVRFHTEQSCTAKQIFDLGHEHLNKALARLVEAQMKCGFEGTKAEFLHHLRTDKKFRFESEEEILDLYRQNCDKIMKILPNFFENMPDMKLEVVPAPTEISREYVNAAYTAGSPDKSRPGYLVVNTYRPEVRMSFEVPALTVHEALPGHHIQLALTMEAPLKDFRRFADELRYWDPPAHLGMKSGYHEGWASYAEYLGIEMGLYEDPYDMVGKISRETVLATRLIVDTGLHMFGWGRQQAIDFMLENTPCDEYDIICEVDRYISLPGQSLSYGYGEMKMREHRSRAEKALGDKFDIRSFNTMVATIGDVPLFLLEREVNKFIAERS